MATYRINIEDAGVIYYLMSEKLKTAKELASDYDIALSTVYSIANGTRWSKKREVWENNA